MRKEISPYHNKSIKAMKVIKRVSQQISITEYCLGWESMVLPYVGAGSPDCSLFFNLFVYNHKLAATISET
jgi:hypothetical protein